MPSFNTLQTGKNLSRDYTEYYMLMDNPLNKHHFTIKQTIAWSVLCICLLFISNSLHADKSFIKCWKNAEGLTECGNRIPREYYNQRVRYIDSTGITRKIKERAKTREELEAQKETDRLLALEAKQQRQSKQYDDVLLQTYLNIDDLLASLNSKLAIIESRAKVLESNIELKKREFGNLVRTAANAERSGRDISKQLAEKLSEARTTLRNLQAQVSSQEKSTEQIKKVFAHDVERFVLTKSQRIRHSLSSPSAAKKLHAVKLSCLSPAQCDLHWQNARAFIEEFATTRLLYITDKVLVTDIPVKNRDVAMSLSVLEGKDTEKQALLFQIRCNREREGQDFCASDEVDSLLKEFKNIVYQE